MGYRSEVAYTIRFSDTDKGRQTFNIFLADAKQNEDTKGCFDEGEEHFKVDMANLAINFYVDYAKWTEGYEGVDCHENLLNMARDYCENTTEVDEENMQRCPLGYLFYRIGEDLNDIDEQYGGDYDWQWLGIRRYIEKDW